MVDFPLLVHTVWADGLIPRYSASLFSSQSKLNVPGVIYHFHPGYRYGGGCERVRHRRSPRFPLPHHWHRHQNMELRERPERLRKWGVNSQEHLSPVCLSHKLHLTLPNYFYTNFVAFNGLFINLFNHFSFDFGIFSPPYWPR